MGLWRVVKVYKSSDLSWLQVLSLQILRLYKRGYSVFKFEITDDEVVIKALKKKQRAEAFVHA
jgi:hypothetical protein